MERKNLMITGLALSALVLFCTLVVLHSRTETARGEVSVQGQNALAHLNCCTVKFQGLSEALVIVDRDTHILRMYSFTNRNFQQVQGSAKDLHETFKRAAAGAVDKKKKA